jgi:hypothetical protein
MPTSPDCIPWWYKPLTDVLAQPWADTRLPVMAGCTGIVEGNVPCAPAKLAAFGEGWLKANHLDVLVLIGGALPQPLYTLARYMQSEMGSGSITERVAVGQAAMNKSKGRVDDLLLYRQPTTSPFRGFYGPIHGPLGTSTAPFGRWAATTIAPTLGTLVIAAFVWSGKTAGFTDGTTQWGPEYLKDASTGKHMKYGTSSERVLSFVRYAASSQGGTLYWVGPLPGVDPWTTWVAKRGPAANTVGGQALIMVGAGGLPLDTSGRPVRRRAPMPTEVCAVTGSGEGGEGGGGGGGPVIADGTKAVLAVAGLALGGLAGWAFNRWRFPTASV